MHVQGGRGAEDSISVLKYNIHVRTVVRKTKHQEEGADSAVEEHVRNINEAWTSTQKG